MMFGGTRRNRSRRIVAAYVANNPVPAANLAELIASIHRAAAGLSKTAASATAPQTPAIANRAGGVATRELAAFLDLPS